MTPVDTASEEVSATPVPNQPKKKKHRARKLIVVLLVIICLLCLGGAGVIFYGYYVGQTAYEEVQTHVSMPAAPEEIMAPSSEASFVDWDALRAINPDIVGWLYMPGTTINYPVMHGTDNDYYLHHDFYGSEGVVANYGSIYLAAENAGDFSDTNNVLFGHHLNNGTMFSAISNMGDPEAFNAARKSYLLTPEGNYELTSFAILHVASDDPIAQLTFPDQEAYVDYLQDKVNRSEVAATDVPDLGNLDKTFLFSTCDNLYTNGRWVLCNYVSEFVSADEALGEGASNEAVDAAAAAESGVNPAQAELDAQAAAEAEAAAQAQAEAEAAA